MFEGHFSPHKAAATLSREPIFAGATLPVVVFDWYAQISGQRDAIDDPSISGPESRTLTLLGTITIARPADTPELDKQALFLTGTTHPGIEPADPMQT